MYPKRRTKLELEEMAGGGGGGGGAGGLFACGAYGPSELPAGIWITKDGGSAGKGSPGSNGGPGGVILYFGVRKNWFPARSGIKAAVHCWIGLAVG
ncbi:MAG: hypothetical protein ACLUES_12860 [Flavonifractor plautii]